MFKKGKCTNKPLQGKCTNKPLQGKCTNKPLQEYVIIFSYV